MTKARIAEINTTTGTKYRVFMFDGEEWICIPYITEKKTYAGAKKSAEKLNMEVVA